MVDTRRKLIAKYPHDLYKMTFILYRFTVFQVCTEIFNTVHKISTANSSDIDTFSRNSI